MKYCSFRGPEIDPWLIHRAQRQRTLGADVKAMAIGTALSYLSDNIAITGCANGHVGNGDTPGLVNGMNNLICQR